MSSVHRRNLIAAGASLLLVAGLGIGVAVREGGGEDGAPVRTYADWMRLETSFLESVERTERDTGLIFSMLRDEEAPHAARLAAVRVLQRLAPTEFYEQALANVSVEVPSWTFPDRGGRIVRNLLAHRMWDLTPVVLASVEAREPEDPFVEDAAVILRRSWPKGIAVEVARGWRKVEHDLGNEVPALDRLVELLAAE